MRPQFLTDGVGKLDAVFAEVSCQSVTSPEVDSTDLLVNTSK
jgi:hypothetical protein